MIEADFRNILSGELVMIGVQLRVKPAVQEAISLNGARFLIANVEHLVQTDFEPPHGHRLIVWVAPTK